MSLIPALEDFRAKWAEAAADGKFTLDEINEITIEGIDVLEPILDSLQPGNEQAIASLEEDVLEIVDDLVEKLPKGRLLAKPTVLAAASFAIPWLIRGAAASGQPFRVWLQENALPITRGFEQTLHRLNAAIGD